MAALMLMPETAMDENYLPVRNKNQVRLSRKISGVKRVTIAHGVDESSDEHLRGCILGPDGAHARATLFRRKGINHGG